MLRRKVGKVQKSQKEQAKGVPPREERKNRTMVVKPHAFQKERKDERIFI